MLVNDNTAECGI